MSISPHRQKPCPCGSGLPFGACHGADATQASEENEPRHSLIVSRADKPAARLGSAGCIIFISYARQDADIARSLRAWLATCGHHSVFLDADPDVGIAAGAEWEQTLHNRLRAASAVIVLWSAAASRSHWVFAEIAIARNRYKPLIPLCLDETPLPSILGGLQAIQVRRNSADFHELMHGLERVGIAPRSAAFGQAPYPGLLPFEEANAGLFFGRDEEIQRAVEAVTRAAQFGDPRLVVLFGPSGVGKSSLLRAGLLPRLRQDSRLVLVEPFRPGSMPLHALSAALAESLSSVGLPSDRRELLANFESEVEGSSATQGSAGSWSRCADDLRNAAGRREATLVVLIDQLEDLFATRPNDPEASEVGATQTDAANRFLSLLRNVVQDEPPTVIVVTLRVDFLDALQSSAPFRDLPHLAESLFSLSAISSQQLRETIEFPAQLAEGSVEPQLVDALVQDSDTEFGLPLLADTLSELWNSSSTKTLELRDYQSLGRLDGIIARAADELLRKHAPSEAALRRAFLSMVAVDGQGRMTRRSIFETDHTEAAPVLKAFERRRLVVVGEQEGQRTFDVAHEALFRAWKRLARWLEEERAFLSWRSWLRETMARASQTKSKPSQLLHGFELTEAKGWLERAGTLLIEREREFVRSAADDALQAERRRKRNVVLVIGALACSLLLAIFQWRAAEAARVEATAQGNRARSERDAAEKARSAAEKAKSAAEARAWDERTTQSATAKATRIAIDGKAEQVLCDTNYCWVVLEPELGKVARFAPSRPDAIEYFQTGPVNDVVLTDGRLFCLDKGSPRETRAPRITVLSAARQPERFPMEGDPVGMAADGSGVVVLKGRKEPGKVSVDLTGLAWGGAPDGVLQGTSSLFITSNDDMPDWKGSHLIRVLDEVWVGSRRWPHLLRVRRDGDSGARKVKMTSVELPVGAAQLAYDGGSIWAVQHLESQFNLIEPSSEKVETRDAGVPVDSVFYDGRAVWLFSKVTGRLLAYDRRESTLTPRTILLPTSDIVTRPLVADDKKSLSMRFFPGQLAADMSPPRRLAADGVFLYVVLQDGQLYRVPLLSFPSNGSPSAVLGTRDHLWIANRDAGQVTRATYGGRYAGAFKVGKWPAALAYYDKSVWVANQGDGTVSRLDETTGQHQKTYGVGGRPLALAATLEGVWVADHAGGASLVFISRTTSDIQHVKLSGKGALAGVQGVEQPSFLAWDGELLWSTFEEGPKGLIGFRPSTRQADWALSYEFEKPASKKPSQRQGKSGPPDVVIEPEPATAPAWTMPGGASVYDRRSGCLWTLVKSTSLSCLRTGPNPTQGPQLAVGSGFQVGFENSWSLQPGGSSVWFGNAHTGTVTPILGSERGSEKLVAGPSIAYPTNVTLGFKTSGIFTGLAWGEGDLWAVHGGDESVMRIMLSSVGNPVLPVGGCTDDGEEQWWRIQWDHVGSARFARRIDLGPQPLDLSRQASRRLVLTLKYDGTEPRRKVLTRVRDATGQTFDKAVELESCTKRQLTITEVELSRGKLDPRRLTALEFDIAEVQKNERGLIYVWGVPKGATAGK
ncbi:MAG TPA: TIR domain-containing protein [Polyangiaceae bacterium]|nr:TIR domain-containing protein [Polyangiaceae bacterium]